MPLINPYKLFYKRIGYEFANAANLSLALTHRSAASQHNERLEYLGDAVLGMVIAKALFSRFSASPEGDLTRMRASLVKGVTLAEVAREFDLGELLLLGPGELKSGGFRRDSILADTLEAIIGAIYLEAGLEVCEPLILSWFASRLTALDPDITQKDNKTCLQEFLQARKLPLPVYQVSEITGKSHEQTFFVECTIEGLAKAVIGKGHSRRIAEQQAAKRAFEILQK